MRRQHLPLRSQLLRHNFLQLAPPQPADDRPSPDPHLRLVLPLGLRLSPRGAFTPQPPPPRRPHQPPPHPRLLPPRLPPRSVRRALLGLPRRDGKTGEGVPRARVHRGRGVCAGPRPRGRLRAVERGVSGGDEEFSAGGPGGVRPKGRAGERAAGNGPGEVAAVRRRERRRRTELRARVLSQSDAAVGVSGGVWAEWRRRRGWLFVSAAERPYRWTVRGVGSFGKNQPDASSIRICRAAAYFSGYLPIVLVSFGCG
mmetsp:Transcript_3756/g.6986  ORF Transcript_3756/g.6986 Transcript_3756/m.6986 type:complete len:256 (-) Transcript_3756:311-1078(-)